MYINTFKYTPKDVSCQLCTEYVKKLGCTALRCPWLAERIEAGVVGYREAVLETFPHERRLFQRLNLLIKHYPGSLWSNEQHERRMQYQCAVQGYRRRRDTNAYYAAMYLLTSNDDIYRRTANCFCKDGIEFGYAKMQRGEYQSKICPYGYRKSADGRMEPDPEAAAVVQLIFQLAAEGINATAITRELFRRSIPTPGQYKAAHGNHTHDISRCHGIWSASTILRILEDERYTGVYVIGKRAVLEVGGTRSRLKDRESWYIIPDHHPAIIEKAVFDTVQASQLRFSQPNKKKRDYPLKGKAFCGCCGHALSRTMQKTSYYYCRHSEADVESRCHKMRLNAAELEQAVFLTLKKQMEAAAPFAPDGSLRVDASVPERAEYEQQIETLQDGKRTLYEHYLMGEIDLNTYKAEKAACNELLLKTKNAYAAVLAQAKQKQDEQARQDSRKEASKAIFDADTLTTELAELLIDRVLVYPDKRIEIAYKIQDIFD